MTPTDEENPNQPEPEQASEDEAVLEVDRTALHALEREITATHLFVWTMNDSGVLQSTRIPISDIPQKISDARRIMDRDLGQAIQIVKGASVGFDTAVQRWDAQVRQSELSLRSSRKPGKLNQVVGKHNQIRARLAPVKSVFRRALTVLQEAEARVQHPSPGAATAESEADQ